jgi:antitoxin MazE
MSTRPKTTTKLTKIGNSRGIRIPKALIEQAGLTDEVELIARDGEILIANMRKPREGWAEAMEEAYKRGDLEPTPEEIEWLAVGPPIPQELLDDEDGWWEK